MLIAEAYHVYDFQVLGGPKWLDEDRYDIEAKAEGFLPAATATEVKTGAQPRLTECTGL